MKTITRRGFINVTGITFGAALLRPSLLEPLLFPSGSEKPWYLQSWYLKVQSYECRRRFNAEAVLRDAQRAGIDTIIYSVHEGGAHYDSAFYTRCSRIEQGFDPLGYLVERGNELGINIYAWICPGVDCLEFDPTWDISGRYGAPLELHWLDFSLPAARERVRDIAADITSKYIVGICVDYMRYYRGTIPWLAGNHEELSTQDITTTVAMIKTAITPRQLTASVMSHDYSYVLQDWPAWLRLGVVDILQPRIYAYQAGQILAWINKWDKDLPQEKIVPCLSLYNLNEKPKEIKSMAELQIEISECKALNLDTMGLGFFDSGGLNIENSALIRNLKYKNQNDRDRIPF